MRTIKELLILLREELTYNFDGCICYSTEMMMDSDVINYDEFFLLDNYIHSHVPSHVKDPDHFWWPYGELAPRLEFLDKLIAEIDEN